LAENNKTKYNEKNSKEMLLTRKKHNEQKEVRVYMNNNIILQVHKLKYLALMFDCNLKFRIHIYFEMEEAYISAA